MAQFIDALSRPDEADRIVSALTSKQVHDLISRVPESSRDIGDAHALGLAVASLVNVADRVPEDFQLRNRLSDLCANWANRAAEQATLDAALANASSISGAAMIVSLHSRGHRRRGRVNDADSDQRFEAIALRSAEFLLERLTAASASELTAERDFISLLRYLVEAGTRGVDKLRSLADDDDEVFIAVLEMATEHYEDGPWFEWDKAAGLLGESRLWTRLAEIQSNSDAVIQARDKARSQRMRSPD